MKIACIGSRDAPLSALTDMRSIAGHIVRKGHIVATGNAKGSDQAFATGGNNRNTHLVHLYLPWQRYEQHAIRSGNSIRVVGDNLDDFWVQCEEVAADNHPAWQYLSDAVMNLMIRNAAILHSADACIAYLNHSKRGGGGTGHGWRIAGSMGIPRFDISNNEGLQTAIRFVNSLRDESAQRIAVTANIRNVVADPDW